MEGAYKEGGEGEVGRSVGGGERGESSNGWQLVEDKGFSRWGNKGDKAFR